MATQQQTKIWNTSYILLCTATILTFGHSWLLGPALPLFVRDELNGSEFLVGLVLGVFALASMGIRPLMGYWADRLNMVLMLTLGSLFLGLSGFLYLLPVLWIVFLATFLRGLAWAGLNTGGLGFLAQVAPPGRRGEAASYYTLFQRIAGAFAPAIALWLIDSPGGFNSVFLLAGFAGLGATAIAWSIPNKKGAVEGQAAVLKEAIAPLPALSLLYERSVTLPTTLQILAVTAGPAVTSFIPLYADEIGVDNIGLYFIVGGATSIILRIFFGRLIDILGRGLSIMIGMLFTMLGLALIPVYESLTFILVAGICYSIGESLTTPGTTALAIDRADALRPGAAMATFSLAYPVAQFIGAPLSGGLVEVVGYKAMYLGMIALPALGFIVTIANMSTLRKEGAPQPSEAA